MSKLFVRNVVDTTTDFHIDSQMTLVKYVGKDTNVVIPDGVKAIGVCAFKETDVETVKIPASVCRVDSGAFIYCRCLRDVIFEGRTEGCVYIADTAFRSCSKLVHIKLSNTLTKIRRHTFKDCDSLSEIDIPSSVTLIENGAFDNCKNLKKILVRSEYTNVESDAFPSFMVEV